MKKAVVLLLALGAIIFSGGLLFIAKNSGDSRAFGIAQMATSLVVIWILFGGAIMCAGRDKVRMFMQSLPGKWQIKFVLFATVLALLEEAVTTTLTNLAPLFGSRAGEAYITASANYFDVVLLHSVIVFIPLFVGWALLLTYYDFEAFSTFLLFGVMGILCEASFIGPTAIIGFPMWIFVYGLMVYLPTYSIPAVRGQRPIRFYHYIVAIPTVFLLSLPLLLPLVLFITKVLHHPTIHFVQ